MKKKLFLLVFCCLITACNRPILQIPITQTPAISIYEANSTRTPTKIIKSSSATHPAQLSSTPSQSPVPSPTSSSTPWWSTLTLEPTFTPYPTPVWCPVEAAPRTDSGTLRLVYVSQDKLWLQDEGGQAVQLTQSGGIGKVTNSDDGQIIAFTRQSDENHAELWAINADGSNERRLVSADELAQLDGSKETLGVLPTGLMWEPGTHRLIFGTYPVYDGIWIYEPSIYWLLNADTDTITTAPYHGGYIAYSPDGKQAAIYSTDGLSLVNTDGSNLREHILPGYHGIGEGESYYHPQPYWAPDSTSLLLALPDQDDMYSNKGTVTVWRVPVNGTPEKIGQWKAFAPSVQFSPDQTYMAYWRWPKPAKNLREMHLVQLKGSTSDNSDDTIYISEYLISDAVWSPDSQHFIFNMGDPEKKVQQFLGYICQRPQLIFENTNGANAIWVDASRYLLEISLLDNPDQWELRLGKIDQEQLKVLGMVTSYDWILLP